MIPRPRGCRCADNATEHAVLCIYYPRPGWYWLSFVDDDGKFLGVAVVQAKCVADAVPASWRKRCNPGGAVEITAPLPEGMPDPPEGYAHRLLTRDEAEHLDMLWASIINAARAN